MAIKRCPSCGQTYIDDDINFCLNDGELLSYFADGTPQTLFGDGRQSRTFVDDSPPTVLLNDPLVTNQNKWPSSGAADIWQGGKQNFPQQQFAQYPSIVSPNQTLAIASLGLGIGSLTIGWCCSLGLLLSPAALITGFIALSQIKKNPQANGGRGFAIGGIIAGALYCAFYLVILLIYGITLIGGIR